MPADLVTRLLLQNKDFNRNLEESKGGLSKFNSKIDASGASVSAYSSKITTLGATSLLKLAGGIGVAVSAGEAFEKMMRSNQTTSDIFDNNLNAAKDSVDSFFYSLATGDWTTFQSGIIDTYERLKNLSSLMDELADKKLSLGYIKADDLKDIERFEQIAKDTNQSFEDRLNAAQNMQGVINRLNKKTQETVDLQLRTLNERYAAKSGLNIDVSDLDYFVKNTNFSGSLTTEANAAYKEFVRLNNEAKKLRDAAVYDFKTYGFDPSRSAQKEYNQLRDTASLYKEQNDFLIKQGWLTEENDEARKQLVQTLIENLNAEKEIYALQKKADRTGRSIHTQGKTKESNTKGVKETVKIDKQSMFQITDSQAIRNGLEKDIQQTVFGTPLVTHIKLSPTYDKNDEGLPLYKSDEDEYFKYLESQLHDSSESVENYQKKIQAVTLAYNEATTDGLRALYAKQKEDLENHLAEMTDMNQGMIDISRELNSLLQSGVSLGFESIGEAIGSGDGAEAMRNMLMGLMDMLKQFGEALVAAGIAKLAFDKLFANPFAAIAAGGALIIAVTAAKSAIQSAGNYTEGGIVPYNNFTIGDRMVAHVNGGEMILNPGQQAKLFDLLDKGRPGESEDIIRVTGRIVGEGSQMAVVLNEYAKKQRRGR